MLTYFSKNRHGVVSVFMAIILIVIISFSSLMVELGRKRNLDSYFQQVIETSTFSTLSNYDRKLYKKFSLMALSSNVDETTLQKYINANLNSGIDSQKTLDREMLLEEIEVQGIYDLANPDVLRQQIEENWKYRGPYNIVDGTLNLEKSLTDYVNTLEKAVPALQFFKNISSSFQKITEVVEKAVEVSNSIDQLDEASDAYEDGLSIYNAAVEEYENNINGLDAEDENYAEKKASYDSAIESASITFKNQIQTYITACDSFANSVDEFASKYAEFASLGMDIALQSLAKDELDKLNTGTDGYQEWTNKEKENYQKALEEMANAGSTDEVSGVLQSIKDYVEDVKKEKFENLTKDLVEQKDSIKGDDWPKVSVIKPKIGFIVGITLLLDYAVYLLDTCTKLIKLVKKLWDALKMLVDIVKCIASAAVFMGPNIQYNDSISAVINDLPSKNSSSTTPTSVTSDQTYVTDQLEKTEDISLEVGYNTGYINPTIDNSSLALSEKIDNFRQKADTLLADGDALKNYLLNFEILNFMRQIVVVLCDVIELLNSLLEVMNAFITHMLGGTSLLEVIYRKLMIADYAAMMFPNRTTKYADDKDGLDNDWTDRAEGWSESNLSAISIRDTDNFSLARAEYIFAGNADEMTNQTIVYGVMYGLRALSNVFPTVTNKIILDLVKTAPPFGVIAAIIIGFVFMLLETIVDMILLCYGRVKLPLVKTDLWCFTAEGARDLMEKFKEMAPEVGDALESKLKSDVAKDPEGRNGKTYIEEANDKFVEGLQIGYWGYTDYLRFIFTFSSEKKMLLRIADLIQLEMTKASGEEYNLKEKYTYMRIKAKAKYKAVMPIPFVTNANSEFLSINKIYYMGY